MNGQRNDTNKMETNLIRLDKHEHFIMKNLMFEHNILADGMPHRCPVCLSTLLSYENSVLAHIKPISFIGNLPEDKKTMIDQMKQEINHWSNLIISCVECDQQMADEHMREWRDRMFPKFKSFYIKDRPVHEKPVPVTLCIGYILTKTVKKTKWNIQEQQTGLWIPGIIGMVPETIPVAVPYIESCPIYEPILMKAFRVGQNYYNTQGILINGCGEPLLPIF